MEPDAHRLDRERLLADRIAVADRVRRDVDVVVEAAVEKRRSYLEWFVNHMRIEAKGELERRRLRTDLRAAAAMPAARRETAAPAQRESVWWEEAVIDEAPLSWAATG